MLPDRLQIAEMLQNIVAFLCCALKEGPDPGDDGCVAGYLMYRLKIPPDLIGRVVLPHVNLLCSQDILIDKHHRVQIVKVPVLGSNRVMSKVRPLYGTKDVFSDIAQAKHMLYASLPNAPV